MAYRKKEPVACGDTIDMFGSNSGRAPARKKVSEEIVKRRIKTLLDKYGAHWFMPVQGQFARKGVSDFIVCLDGGRYLAIEAKSSHGEATALQEQWIENVRKRGGLALVVGPDELPALEKILELTRARQNVLVAGLTAGVSGL